jgi:hypothetical protein
MMEGLAIHVPYVQLVYAVFFTQGLNLVSICLPRLMSLKDQDIKQDVVLPLQEAHTTITFLP